MKSQNSQELSELSVAELLHLACVYWEVPEELGPVNKELTERLKRDGRLS